MSRLTLFSILLFTASSLFAQTHIDAGVAMGLQSYESAGESPRGLPSVDLLVRGEHLGVHAAVEYTDLDQLGAMIATHVDGVYRAGDRFFVLAGAGVTQIHTGSSSLTWNAEAEVGRAFRSMEVFVRARHYDYRSEERFRDRPASPNGPAISVGVRFALRR